LIEGQARVYFQQVLSGALRKRTNMQTGHVCSIQRSGRVGLHVMVSGARQYPAVAATCCLLNTCLGVGIAYCHAQGVYHRDLKLENLLMATPKSDQVKIMVGSRRPLRASGCPAVPRREHHGHTPL
jgi:serine/threonine protein kinase